MERTKNVVRPRMQGQALDPTGGDTEDKQIQKAMCIVDLVVEELMAQAPENVRVSQEVNSLYERLHEFGLGRVDSLKRSANPEVDKSMRGQFKQMEEVKDREEHDVTTAVTGLVKSFLRDVPENLRLDKLNANVCSGVEDEQPDKQAVVNGIKSALKQVLQGNYKNVHYISSLLEEMRNDNQMSAATFPDLLSRYNLSPDEEQPTDHVYHKDATQTNIPGYQSLPLEPGGSHPQQFWERYNNLEYFCSNGDNNNVDDNNESSKRKLPREPMHVPGERALSPQTPGMANIQDRFCSQQAMSVDEPGAIEGSVDDKLKVFMLHLDISALHENIDDLDSMTEERLSVQVDPVCHNLKESSDLSVKDMLCPSVMEAPMSPSAYHNNGLFRASLNTDEPPLPPVEQDLYKKYSDGECNYNMKQLTIKIQGLKKKIKSFDENYEMDHGYKPSQGEKAAQPHIKKYMSKLTKARKDLKRLKEDAENGNRSKHGSCGSPFDAKHPMAMSLDFILQSLGGKRSPAGKTENIKASTALELQTVPEDEMMEIPMSFTRDSIEEGEYLNEEKADNLDKVFAQQDRTNSNNLDLADTHPKHGVHGWKDGSIRALDPDGDSHFHEMSLPELCREMEFSRMQKGRLRRAIREFENDFFAKYGRKVRKENRFPLQREYADYKKVKGRLRLLEALILKHYE